MRGQGEASQAMRGVRKWTLGQLWLSAPCPQGEHVHNVSCLLTSRAESDSPRLACPQPPTVPRLGVSASTEAVKPHDAGASHLGLCCRHLVSLSIRVGPVPRGLWETCLQTAKPCTSVKFALQRKEKKSRSF